MSGCLTYKRLYLTNPTENEVEALSPKLSDSTPAFVSVKKGELMFLDCTLTFHMYSNISNTLLYPSFPPSLFYCAFIGTSGLVKSKEFTHADLLQHESFWFAKNVIEKKYFEC